MLTKNAALVESLAVDPDNAVLDRRERALVDYVLKLTRTPRDVSAADVDALRAAGFSDSAIHDAAAVAAYFNFVNRMASGLGVELEPE